jgi:hypothetical protein
MNDRILSKQALDGLNSAAEIKRIVDFCSEGGPMTGELYQFMGWLGEHLRSELSREAWEEPELELADSDGVVLYLFPATWRLPGDDYVAFALWWPSRFWEEAPCIEIYLPAEETFPARNELLNQLRPKLKLAGFTDYDENGDPDPSVPLWKYISLEQFQQNSGFDLDALIAEIAAGFRRLLEVEPVIESVMQSLPNKPAPAPTERALKTIAFLDTESKGSGTARKMTQLAIVNVAYDPKGDAIVGVLDDYFKNLGQKLDAGKARSLLQRAECIVAHNAFGADKPLLASELPETEKMNWLCSWKGIPWKQLLGVQSESLETLMGKAGLRYQQDHNARADAQDLKRLLAIKHKGRTYLGRLLDNA